MGFRRFALCALISTALLGGMAEAQTVTRGPYIQQVGHDSAILRWRTDSTEDALVRFGTSADALDFNESSGAVGTDHEVLLTALDPETRYYYEIGTTTVALAGGDEAHSFVTSPEPGTPEPMRIWVIGDSGTANANAAAVRDAFLGFTGARDPDFWLMLGDNAYSTGTDSEYQAAVFDMYPSILRRVPLWSTMGNHDGANRSTYLDIFSLPTAGEIGGDGSGSELYYSFDHGNVHFICLDSHYSNRVLGGAMLTWLEGDLLGNTSEWVIAFWHHPPYTKGSHDSDTESRLIDMRENAVPMLEDYGVDVVLSGHSHSYERSMLIDGHHDVSGTWNPAMALDDGFGRPDVDGAYVKTWGDGAANEGAVFAVAGSSGKISGGSLNHPAMKVSLNALGSLVLDIHGQRLEARFLDETGAVLDWFTLENGDDITAPAIISATAQSDTSVAVLFAEDLDSISATDEANYAITNGVDVLTASLDGDGRTVHLTTTPIASGSEHWVSAVGVEDLANNAMVYDEASFAFVAVASLAFQDGVAPTPAYDGTSDTTLSQNSPATNYGLATTLLADGDDPGGTGNDKSFLLAWDISAIPAGAIVEAATITLQVENPSGNLYPAYQVLRDWYEVEATWQDYASGVAWNVPGASGLADRGATVVAEVAGAAAGSVEVPLNEAGLAMVQDWLDGSAANYGIIIASPSNGDGLDLSSREATAANAHPRLAITYSMLPEPGDSEAPSAPLNLATTSISTGSVGLTWDPSADNVGVAGYRVFRDGDELLPPVGGTSFSDTGVTAGATHSYTVVAYDAAGNVSAASAALDVPVPLPPAATAAVGDIAMALRIIGRKHQGATAGISIVDENSNPLANATVSGQWSGLVSQSVSGLTDGNGILSVSSSKVSQNASGEFRFTVTGVSASGHTYTPASNVETSDCINTDGAACGTPPPPPPPPGDPVTLTLDTVTMALAQSRKHWRGTADVSVLGDETALTGATVTGDWQLMGPIGVVAELGGDSAVSDGGGIANLSSPKQRAGSGEWFRLTITDISAPDGTYDGGSSTHNTPAVP
jgi:hypothetical protein